jgi:hypothetical protein
MFHCLKYIASFPRRTCHIRPPNRYIRAALFDIRAKNPAQRLSNMVTMPAKRRQRFADPNPLNAAPIIGPVVTIRKHQLGFSGNHGLV